MSELISSIYWYFLIPNTSLGLAALPYRIVITYCYLASVIDLFIPNTSIPYLRAACTILDLNRFCLGIVLRI